MDTLLGDYRVTWLLVAVVCLPTEPPAGLNAGSQLLADYIRGWTISALSAHVGLCKHIQIRPCQTLGVANVAMLNI